MSDPQIDRQRPSPYFNVTSAPLTPAPTPAKAPAPPAPAAPAPLGGTDSHESGQAAHGAHGQGHGTAATVAHALHTAHAAAEAVEDAQERLHHATKGGDPRATIAAHRELGHACDHLEKQITAAQQQAARAKGGVPAALREQMSGLQRRLVSATRAYRASGAAAVAASRALREPATLLDRASAAAGRVIGGRVVGAATRVASRSLGVAYAGAAAVKAYSDSPCRTTPGRILHAGLAGGMAAITPPAVAIPDAVVGSPVMHFLEGTAATFAALDEDVVRSVAGGPDGASEEVARRSRRDGYGVHHGRFVRAGDLVAETAADAAVKWTELQRRYSLPALAVQGVRRLLP